MVVSVLGCLVAAESSAGDGETGHSISDARRVVHARLATTYVVQI